MRGPRVLVFDSGLGGLTVLAQVRKARPDAMLIYAADDAAFPYAALGESELVSRVASMMERLVADHAPDLVVIACSTASTLVLGPLRARFPALRANTRACSHALRTPALSRASLQRVPLDLRCTRFPFRVERTCLLK